VKNVKMENKKDADAAAAAAAAPLPSVGAVVGNVIADTHLMTQDAPLTTTATTAPKRGGAKYDFTALEKLDIGTLSEVSGLFENALVGVRAQQSGQEVTRQSLHLARDASGGVGG
jgi:hypothetical protein